MTWLQVVRCYQKASRRLADRLAPLDLSNAQLDVLANLLAGPAEGMTQEQLGQRLLVTKGNVSGMLDRMGERELVERRPHPEDRRSKLVHLTPRGRQLAEKAVLIQRQFIAELMEAVPPKELAILAGTMEHVEQRIDTL